MKIIEQTQELVSGLDERTFYIAIGGIFFVILLMAGFLMYFTRSHINSWQTKIDDINSQRRTIQMSLTRFAQIKKQRQAVNTMLSKDKSFKILKTFQEALASLNLSRNLTSEERMTTIRQDKDYTEIILTASLKELSMQKLTDLLQKLSKNELVYPKKLDISKSKGMPPAIDVTLTIATLIPTSEVA